MKESKVMPQSWQWKRRPTNCPWWNELSLVVSATASSVRREEATKKLAVEGATDLLVMPATTSGMTKRGGFWKGGDLGRAKEMKIQGHTAGLES